MSRFTFIYSSFIMFFRKILKRNFKQRAFDFLKTINFFKLIMRLCKNCFRFRTSCRVNENFEKCVKCIASNRRCDLSISFVIIRRIHNEKKQIRKKVRKIRVNATVAQKKQTTKLKKFRNAISIVFCLKRQFEIFENQKKN